MILHCFFVSDGKISKFPRVFGFFPTHPIDFKLTPSIFFMDLQRKAKSLPFGSDPNNGGGKSRLARKRERERVNVTRHQSNRIVLHTCLCSTWKVLSSTGSLKIFFSAKNSCSWFCSKISSIRACNYWYFLVQCKLSLTQSHSCAIC